MINNRGMTLIELVIATTIGAIVLLGGSLILVTIMKMNFYMRHSAEQRENALLFGQVIDNYIGAGVNVQWTDRDIVNIADTDVGRIRFYNSDLDADPISPPTTLGLFLREAGFISATNTASDIRGTAIYFKNPTPREPGVLTIASTEPGVGSATLSSEEYIHRFTDIVEFELRPAGLPLRANDEVRVVQLRIVFRRFSENRPELWSWCPARMMGVRPGCNAQLTFKDDTHIYNIPLPNNMIETNYSVQGAIGPSASSTMRKDTVMGGVYFFRPTRAAQ